MLSILGVGAQEMPSVMQELQKPTNENAVYATTDESALYR
jgi:hypothetical protein